MMREEADKTKRNADRIELSCMGRAKVEAVKPFADIGVSRMIVAPPGFDKEALSRGLEKIGNEVIARA